MFLVLPLLASCAANDDATFQSYTFSDHVVWNLTCPFAKRAFIFIDSTATNVRVYDGTWSRTLEKPYALGSTMNVTVEFDAGESTQLVRILTAVTDCFNGAYYIGGGSEVSFSAAGNSSDHTDTHYCLFSPSADEQPVEVSYGMTEYRRFWEKATIYWQDVQGTASKACESNETCTVSLPNSMYYVSYYKADKFDGGIEFARTNTNSTNAFAECNQAPIPYAPAMQMRIPYNVTAATSSCVPKNQS